MQMIVNRENWLYIQEYAQKVRENNPQTSFADSIKETANSTADAPAAGAVLDKLSDSSVQLLKRMKDGSKNVNYDEWAGLLRELRDMGAITKDDYAWAPKGGCEYVPASGGILCIPKGDIVPIPVVPGIMQCGPEETNIDQMLDGLCDWPGDPLEKLENLALYMRKWIGILDVSQDSEGNPGSWYSGPYATCEAANLNVLKTIRELMAAV